MVFARARGVPGLTLNLCKMNMPLICNDLFSFKIKDLGGSPGNLLIYIPIFSFVIKHLTPGPHKYLICQD
jgi:hypothetical protein